MLHCGLHAINAILLKIKKVPYTSIELDHITHEVHRRETQLCPQAKDTVPQQEGNYPLESLLVALRRQNLCAIFEKARSLDRGGHIIIPKNVVGFLLGTGNHYLAIVRTRPKERAASHWELVDNGNVIGDPHASPFTIIQDLQPVAVLRVISCPL